VGKLHPIAYHLRIMEAAEEKYNIHDEEPLAVVEAFKHW
jgi:hypothetical protein